MDKVEKMWNGHRVFCGCNDNYGRVDDHQFIDDDSEFDAMCPACGNYFWYYEDKNNEPR